MENSVISPLTAAAFPTFADLCKQYGETFALRVVRQYVRYYNYDLDHALDVANDYELRTGDSGPLDVLTTLHEKNELHRVCDFFICQSF